MLVSEKKHIIQKQITEIHFEDLDDAMGVQNRIAEVFYERLQPKMEALFNELVDKDHIAFAEKMEIDCGILSDKHWEDEWVDTVLRKLKEEIAVINKRKLQPDKIKEDFFFFLEYGRLPWNSVVGSIKVFEEGIVVNAYFFELLKKALRQETAVKRLMNQFSESFIIQLIHALLPDHPTTTRKQQEIILQTFAKEPNGVLTENDLSPMKKSTNTVEEKEAELHPTADPDLSTGVYINNAGLVILHPFLTGLFENLQLTRDNIWIDEEAQHRAVIITEFLVTGATEAPEFNLSLNKLLCGLKITDALVETPGIDTPIQEACEELLSAVIKHWSSLKNTGIDALRETFLQRCGKLSKVDHGRLLQVEQKGVDILLNSLPWGMGVIKFPWMKELLYTEWKG